jgi:uridine phosphorylase
VRRECTVTRDLSEPIHLQPTAPLAERVLLPGDPGRALLLAQELLDRPTMFNHNRGLWGYTGAAADGRPMTIQSTGMGGPSAAIVISELADLGARRLVRLGTCGALDPTLALGQLLVVTEAIATDGTSRTLGAGDRIAPDQALTAALHAAAPNVATGVIASTDLFYEGRDEEWSWRSAGARAVEMECATLFALAARRGLAAGAALIVTDTRGETHRRIDAEMLRDAEHRLGWLAAGALTAGAGWGANDVPAYSDAGLPAV